MKYPDFDSFQAFQARRIEPKQRWVGGRFGWAFHRFPIKGGISLIEVIAYSAMQSNPLLHRLRQIGDEQ